MFVEISFVKLVLNWPLTNEIDTYYIMFMYIFGEKSFSEQA